SNSGTQVFTLSNTGAAAATGCSAPSLDNVTDFSITADTCATNDVAASGSCTVTVRANPGSVGSKVATLSRTCTFGGTPTTTPNQIVVNGITATLAWSPLTKDFGSVNVGSLSGIQVFTLSNTGAAAATGCSAPSLSDSTNFTITADTCATNDVAASGSCTVSVQAAPGSAGSKATTLSRTCTFGGTPTTTANQIIVTGVEPALAWNPLTNDYGSVNVGSLSSGTTFTLSNSGTANATGCSAPVLSGANSGDFALSSDTCGTANLNTSSSCTIVVKAQPTAAGARTATLSRTCTFGGTPTTTANQIVVTGIAPSLAWSPLTKDFGNVNVGSLSSGTTFTLSNTGTANATGCSAPTIDNSTDFQLSSDTCGTANLGTSSSCTIVVKAQPQSAGAKAATLSRTCTFGGTPTTTTNQIVVNGITAVLAWSPLTKDFGNVNVGSNSGTQVFTLSNTGAADATGCSAPALGDSTNFSITADTCSTNNVTASGSCTVTVRANPTTAGSKATTLSRTCTFGGTPTTTPNQIVTNGIEPALAWNPLTNDFGSVNVGSLSTGTTFTLSNSGTANATGCSAPTLTGANPGDFTLSSDTCGTANLNTSSSCTIVVKAQPTAAGSRTATLSRTCTFGGTPTTTANQIVVTGTAPALAWSPLTKDFGNINVGSLSTGTTFTLSNTGTANATGCSAPTIDNSTDFQLSSDTCGTANLNASSSCTIVVKGNPQSVGAHTATLSRTCTFGGTPTTTTNQIVVTGTAPALAWSPLTNDFGSISVGSLSTGVTFTLSNSGTANATGCSAPTLAGANPGDFTLSSDTCGTANLNTSSSCTIVVKGNPQSAGAKTATLSRTCTVGGTPTTTANQIVVTGAQPSLAWSPLTNDFGNVYVGSLSSGTTFTLSNSGTANATGCSAPTLTGANPGDFTLSSDTCGTANLNTSSSCTIVVKAQPTATGARTATLSRTCTFGGTPTTTANQIVATGIQPVLAWSPLTKDFGSALNGTTTGTQTFTLSNTGSGAATGCSAPVLAGANPSEFTLSSDTCGTANLGAGSSCTIAVAGHPSSDGAKTATLSRTCTTGGVTTTTANQIVVTGASPNLAWTPLTNAFGNIAYSYGKSASVTFTFTNSGTYASSGCSAPTLTGTNPGEFEISIDNCGTSGQAVGASCTVNVRANLTGTGSKTATLSRTCTVGGTKTTTADMITATGVASGGNLVARSILDDGSGGSGGSGGTIYLQAVSTGRKSSVASVYFGNTGTAALTGCTAPNLSNESPAGQFSIISYDCGASIGAGDHCTVKVQASPTSSGTKTARVNLACTGATTRMSLNVNAQGTALPVSLALDARPSLIVMNDGTLRYTTFGGRLPEVWDSLHTDATLAGGGNYFNCILRTGGAVKCWGENGYGQLGDGTTVDKTWGSPDSTGHNSEVTAIASSATDLTHNSGANHICAVKSGEVWCWGLNDQGQLGDGTTTNRSTAVRAGTLTGADQVTAGPDYTCAHLTNGQLWCWGHNDRGQLGDGTTSSRSSPVQVKTASGTFLSGAQSVAAGYNTTCAIMTDGTARCWGDGGYGNLGNGAKNDSSYANSSVTGISNAVQAAVNPVSTCLLLASGEARCFGANDNHNALGDGTVNDSSVPVVVNGVSKGKQIYNMGYSWVTGYCVVQTDSQVRCWGAADDTPSGDIVNKSRTIAQPIAGLSNVVEMSSGDEDSCARKSDGTVWCFGGYASNGQALDSGSNNRYVNPTTPIALPGISTAIGVASGTQTNCVLLANGTIQCIGLNNYGQLGDGTTNGAQSATVSVSGITTATQISAGGNNTCARLSDATVKCWGRNQHGEVGDGTTAERHSPVSVSGLTNVASVTVGKIYEWDEGSAGHACALLSDGTVRCWGLNTYGELGDGTTTNSTTPVTVTGLTNVASLSLGENHSCALLTDGTVRCWGRNDYGQLGDGTTTERHSPVNAAWYSNVTAIGAARHHTCAVVSGGRVRCWGVNEDIDRHGVLGGGSLNGTIASPSLSAVFSLSGVASLSTGPGYTCAILSGGTVSCWGDDTSGYVDYSTHLMSGFINASGDGSATTANANSTVAANLDDGEFDTQGTDWWGSSGETGNVIYIGNWGTDGISYGYFRFQLPSAIPSGATIDKAYLKLWVTDAAYWDTTKWLVISGDLSANATQVSALGDYPGGATGHTQTTATARWPSAGGGLPGVAGAWNQTVDLSAIVQEIVNSSGGLSSGAYVQFWVYGANLGISKEIGIEDYSKGGGHPAQVHLEWH
ncbi:MAG: choice-of-anchor D domain-containing protein, partial [Bdellovibrionales bacterium]|nr:choice-of-anchor D domain-containing protein [Bdellovibrionales bacterium]